MSKKAYKRVKTRTLRAITTHDLNDYINYLSNASRIVRNNLLAGLARGLGMAIGFSILGALFLYLLTYLAGSGVPVLDRLVSNIMDIVENGRK